MLQLFLPTLKHPKIVLLRWIAGALLCLGLVGCRSDHAPQIPIGIGDGFGGAEMDIPGVGREYWPPSKLQNSWVTTQDGAAALISWCYKIDPTQAKILLLQMATPQPAASASLNAPAKAGE